MAGTPALRARVAGRMAKAVVPRLLAGLPNPSRYRLRQFASKAAAQGKSKDFRVLDAGAGKAPFRNLFDHVTYETADFGQVDNKTYAELDYVCDLTDIPVADESYDLVLCTQVMEHVPDPLAVLRELHRVLKPGGQAWLSAPFFYAEHEKPYDFHRFTQFAWKRMAGQTGFQVKDIQWLEGYYGTVAYQARMAAQKLPSRWLFWRIFLAMLARKATHAEMKKKVMVGMPKNYRVVFVKA
jgi:ubiquinone/menaquinone biosynthesis C-methylase UbiE